jgi:hypothetical protein
MPHVRNLHHEKGRVVEARHGFETFTVDANGVAEVSAETKAALLNEHGALWQDADVDVTAPSARNRGPAARPVIPPPGE